MTFKKGHKGYWLGKKLSKEHRKKISLSIIKENHPLWGKHHTEETKQKMSKSLKGGNSTTFRDGHQFSEETKQKMSKSHIGKSCKNGFKKGHKPWSYIDGRSKFVPPQRYGDDWDKIRYLVYLRDRFTCQHCEIRGIRLDVHHKIPFLISFDNSLNNLITLCRPCHRKEEVRIMRELKLQKMEV